MTDSLENTGLTPSNTPLPPQGLGKWEANVGKGDTRDWDKHKEEGGGDAKNGLKERWEWHETKEKGMRNGRHHEKRPTLDWQVYVILAIFLQESSLPALMVRAIMMLSACVKIFLSVGTIANCYGSSRREFSVCCPGIWAPERSRKHWVNYPEIKKLTTLVPSKSMHLHIAGSVDC